MARVLIVDDDRMLARLLSEFFSLKKIEAETADSAKEALELLSEGKNYQLVITDLVMPEMGGLELLQEIRQKYGNLPVVVMTGMLSFEHTTSSAEKGADDYLLKPFTSLEYVWEVVRKYVS